jgi:hypothetical protein
MSFRAGKRWGILGLLLIPPSCTALPERGPGGEGEMAESQELPSRQMVPIEWGSLVSVTPSEEPSISLLWFQDDAGTVRIVALDLRGPRFRPRATVIRRR